MHRKNQNLQLRKFLAQQPRRFQTGHGRHGDVHQHHVRAQRPCARDRFLAVHRLAHNFQVIQIGQARTDPLPHHRVIIDQQYPDRLFPLIHRRRMFLHKDHAKPERLNSAKLYSTMNNSSHAMLPKHEKTRPQPPIHSQLVEHQNITSFHGWAETQFRTRRPAG